MSLGARGRHERVRSAPRQVAVRLLLAAGCGAALGLPTGPAPSAAPAALGAVAPVTPSAGPVPRTRLRQPPLRRTEPRSPRLPRRGTRSRPAAPPAPLAVRPDVGPLTSAFRWRWGRHHDGIDLAGPWGSPVRAAAAGVVTYAGPSRGYGRLLTIRHRGGAVTAYGHLSSFLVRAGPVRAGQVIAREGNTGHSTGPHLHFEVRLRGVPVDPVPWLRARGVAVAGRQPG